MRYAVRSKTAAAWQAENPTLLNGEMGHVFGTTEFKIGDGLTAWNDLGNAGGGGGGMELLLELTHADLFGPGGATPYLLGGNIPAHDKGNGYKLFLQVCLPSGTAFNQYDGYVFDFNENANIGNDAYNGWPWLTKFIQTSKHLAGGGRLRTDPGNILTVHSAPTTGIIPVHGDKATTIYMEGDIVFTKQDWGVGHTSENMIKGRFHTVLYETTNNGEIIEILDNEISECWMNGTNWGSTSDMLTAIGIIFEQSNSGDYSAWVAPTTDISLKIYKY